MKRYCTIGIWCLILVGCGQSPAESSDTSVIGGTETSAYPAVVMTLDRNGNRCTGTFITSAQLLTAAHCVHDPQTGRRLQATDIKISGTSTAGRSIRVAAGFNPRQVPAANDAVVIEFPEGTGSATMTVDSSGSPKVGDELTFVGFGIQSIDPSEQSNGPPVKRQGSKQISAWEQKVGAPAQLVATTTVTTAGSFTISFTQTDFSPVVLSVTSHQEDEGLTLPEQKDNSAKGNCSLE